MASQTMQMALCIDSSIQTTTKTAEATTQTENDPAAPGTTPSFSANAATSLPSTFAQPLHATSLLTMALTTATTAAAPAPNQPQTPRKRCQTLTSQLIAPLQTLQPIISNPCLPIATTTSQLTMATLTAATLPETAFRTISSTWEAPSMQEIHAQAVNNALKVPTAQQMAFCAYIPTRSLEHIVCSTDDSCHPHCPQRPSIRPPTPPSHPQCTPLAPVMHNEPASMPDASTGSATSSTTCLSMTVMIPQGS